MLAVLFDISTQSYVSKHHCHRSSVNPVDALIFGSRASAAGRTTTMFQNTHAKILNDAESLKVVEKEPGASPQGAGSCLKVRCMIDSSLALDKPLSKVYKIRETTVSILF